MISVAMATHNGERYIGRQLNTILCQLTTEDEVVISDDGSTDRTLEIIESIHSPLIRLHHFTPDNTLPLPERIGQNFANALGQCRGDYIFIADQDDVWLRKKVAVMVEALQEADLTISNSWLMNSDGRCHATRYTTRPPTGHYLLLRPQYQGCCMALRRELLEAILPLPRRMPLYDSYIGLLGECIGRVSYIDEPLIIHRLHQTNASTTHRNPLHYKLSYRIRLLAQIYCRAITHKVKRMKLWKAYR